MTRTIARSGPDTPRPPIRPWWRRRAVLATVGVLLVAGLVLLGVRLSGAGPRAAAPPSTPSASSAPSAGLQQPSPTYAVSCLAVGAAIPGGRLDDAGFREATRGLGPLTMRRSYSSTVPRSFQASLAGEDDAAGLHSFVSWKPPGGDYDGAAAGRYDSLIATWARSVPRTGVFATAFHEPENDMTAGEFVAFERHVYTVVKATNPTIRFGPVYMAYWWDPSKPAHYVGDPAAWWPGSQYADFAGLDWYGRNPAPMTTSASFSNWYAFMAPKGKPLVIPEYGQYILEAGQSPDPSLLQARAAAITQDAAWIFAHPQIKVWIYWEGPEWALTDQVSKRAWQAVADRGCRP